MNNGILAPQPFSSAVSMMDSTMEPLLGNAQPMPIPYHYPQSYDFRIGNSDGVSGKDFVFVIDTTILGSTTISIPLRGVAGNIQSISWGDGTYGAITSSTMQRVGSFETVFVLTGTTSTNITHTYAKHGVYTIILRGFFGLEYGNNISSAIAFLSYGDSNYGRSLLNHGNSTNTIYVPPQIPRAVVTIQACFQNNTKFNHPNVASWNVSNISNMQQVFAGATAFNQNLDSWANQVSGVTNFASTFSPASSFDGSLSGWILGNANCNNMFNSCPSFTGKGIQSWSVGNVTNMAGMFVGCRRLNIGISGDWNWDTKNSTTMNRMFWNTNLANTIFSGWNLNNSTNNQEMFLASTINNCSFLNWSGNNAVSMFQNATLNNCTLSGWKLAGTVTNMFNLDGGNIHLPGWDLRGTTNASSMFLSSFTVKSGLDDWNVSGVTNMTSMFQNGSDFMFADLSNWDISKVTNFNLFMIRSAFVPTPNAAITINNWNIASGCDCSSMFADLRANKIVSLSGWKFLGNNNCFRMFGTANFISLDFSGAYLDTWNTSGISNMQQMFDYQLFFDEDISNWNTSNVTNMSSMFSNCRAFNRNLSGWDTSNVTNMGNMFFNASLFNGSGLENWNTSNVTNMAGMFNMTAGGGINVNLSGWDTSKVTSMVSMFRSSNNFVHPFAGSGIDNWNVTGVTSINNMFNSVSSTNNILKCNLSGWNLCNCTDMTDFMTRCNIGSGNYDILLNSWEASSTGNPIKPWATGINVHFGFAKYTAASSGARQRLINYGWTITDGGFQA